jgi:hypothetical protein
VCTTSTLQNSIPETHDESPIKINYVDLVHNRSRAMPCPSMPMLPCSGVRRQKKIIFDMKLREDPLSMQLAKYVRHASCACRPYGNLPCTRHLMKAHRRRTPNQPHPHESHQAKSICKLCIQDLEKKNVHPRIPQGALASWHALI